MLLEYTPIEEIPICVHKLHNAFHTRKFDPLQTRLNNLRRLYFALKDYEDDIAHAIKRDFNRPLNETKLLEFAPVYSELISTMDNLANWMKDQPPQGVPLLYKFSSPKIQYNPLGVILIIGAYNYPLMLSITPLIGAIAAGNSIALKQSEQTSHTAAVITEMLQECLDNELIQCFNGGVQETTELLNSNFDKVIYTGSNNVGKIIATKCAQNLTPCILELGGKSPVFITKNCKNLDLAAKRCVNTKFSNAGQTCVANDYALVDKEIYKKFIELVIKWTRNLYGDVDSDSYTKIINEQSTQRLKSLIDSTHGDIIYGGESSIPKRYIQPTIIKTNSFDDPIMRSEIFGPIFPIIPYDDLSQIISKVITSHDTPLALYIFSNDKSEQELISKRIRSGAVSINELMIHVGLSQLPFGGVGQSGNGSYHGFASFRAFSHERSYLNHPFWLEFLFQAKYPPISQFDVKLASFFMIPWAIFGRSGHIYDKQTILFTILISMVAIVGLYFGFTSDKENMLPTWDILFTS